MLPGIVSTPYRNDGHPGRWWANKNRFVKSCPLSSARQSVLHTSMSDTSIRYLLAPPPRRIVV